MQLNITINMDNAAFEDDYSELLRILKTVGPKVQQQLLAHYHNLHLEEVDFRLMDINGNTVGRVSISEE